MPMIGVNREDYRLLTGKELIHDYSAPILREPPAYHSRFCSCCGSPVPPADPEEDWFEIPAGVFDDDPQIRPDKHILVELVAAWDTISDSLPQYTVRELVRERLGKELPEDYVLRTHYD